MAEPMDPALMLLAALRCASESLRTYARAHRLTGDDLYQQLGGFPQVLLERIRLQRGQPPELLDIFAAFGASAFVVLTTNLDLEDLDQQGVCDAVSSLVRAGAKRRAADGL